MERPIEEAAKPGFRFMRLAPLAVILFAAVAFFGLGLNRYVTLDTLRDNREALQAYVAANPVVAPAAFIAVYALSTALSLPLGALLTLTGGFLFGTLLGTGLVVAGATLGATILFIAVKAGLADALRASAGEALARMEKGFAANAFSYLLFLRLVPVFPFFIVNVVPAFLGVSLATFVVATFVGIIPGSFVYASVGNGLGALFDKGLEPDLGIIFNWDILIPILGLAVLALIPVAVRAWSGRKT